MSRENLAGQLPMQSFEFFSAHLDSDIIALACTSNCNW
jgi:hypothetical protein